MKKIFILLIGIFVVFNTQAQKFKADAGSVKLEFEKNDVAEFVWLNPVPGMDEVDSKNLKIRIGIIHSEGIDKVVIRHNGQRLSENYNFTRSAVDSNFVEVIQHQIPMVEGSNEIMVAVRDNNGEEFNIKRSFLLVEEGLAAVKNRKSYALIFGTSEYDDSGFQSLNNPVNDAADIGQILRNKYGFEVDFVDNPTYESVMLKLRDYAEMDYDPYDQLFIFFAGHGVYDETFKEGFLVCKDTKYDDPSRKSYIEHRVLANRIDNIPNQHIFLVLDACFSGTFDPEFGKHKGVDEIYADVSKLELISRKLELKTRRFITSGGKEYVPDGRPGMNSPFAARFLEALRSDGGRDGIVTVSDIISYVDLTDPQPRYGAFGSNQNPSEFVFEPGN